MSHTGKAREANALKNAIVVIDSKGQHLASGVMEP